MNKTVLLKAVTGIRIDQGTVAISCVTQRNALSSDKFFPKISLFVQLTD